MKYGYARVSTEDQRTDTQLDALHQAGCDVIFEEKLSGSTMERPQLRRMLAELQPGDVVVVYKMDRIARSLRDLITIMELIEGGGASFKSLTEVIDTKTPAGRMIFQIFGAFAEFERAIIRERCMAGQRAAASRGVHIGRSAKITKEDIPHVRELRADGMTLTEIGRRFGVHLSSVKRALHRVYQ